MKPLTVGSLFSGIGGLELGLERAGMEVRWQVEIEEYPRRVLAKHWPDVPKYEDVRRVGTWLPGRNAKPTEWQVLEPVDLICGGFPCQDISYAGKGAGLEGERSGLWYEFARVVREMGPRYVLVENVPALLTRGLDAVLGTLASLGYDAEWDCIPAQAVGAPHRRDRTFIVAYSDRLGWGEGPPKARREARSAAIGLRGGEADPDVADSERERLEGHTGDGTDGAERPQAGRPACPEGVREGGDPGGWWRTEPDVDRVAHGVPARVDRLRALGNAVVPQVAEFIGRRIVEADAAMRGAA